MAGTPDESRSAAWRCRRCASLSFRCRSDERGRPGEGDRDGDGVERGRARGCRAAAPRAPRPSRPPCCAAPAPAAACPRCSPTRRRERRPAAPVLAARRPADAAVSAVAARDCAWAAAQRRHPGSRLGHAERACTTGSGRSMGVERTRPDSGAVGARSADARRGHANLRARRRAGARPPSHARRARRRRERARGARGAAAARAGGAVAQSPARGDAGRTLHKMGAAALLPAPSPSHPPRHPLLALAAAPARAAREPKAANLRSRTTCRPLGNGGGKTHSPGRGRGVQTPTIDVVFRVIPPSIIAK